MTELSAYIKGFKAEIRRNAVFFGTITASIYNVNRGKDTKWYKWSDIFSGLDSEDEHTTEMTSEQIAMTLHGMFGGVVKQ